MFGKSALLVVMGFMFAFSSYQVNMSRTVINNTDNFSRQYVNTVVQQSALGGMNYAINEVWISGVYSTQYEMVLNACSVRVVVEQVGTDTVRITSRSSRSVFDADEYATTGNSLVVTDSIVAFFKDSAPLSTYFWFTGDENNVHWVTGDTVNGLVHTNGLIKTFGSPVFLEKVTAYQGIDPLPTDPSNLATYNGWEIGLSGQIPSDMSQIINTATADNGGNPPNTVSIYDTLTTFTFLSSGNVIRDVSGAGIDTVALSTIAPSGILYSTDDVRVLGTFSGQLTILSEGNIWIDNDLVYADNPLVNPSSTDLIGLIARENVIITDNFANNTDINIQASMLAINGSIFAENFDSIPSVRKYEYSGKLSSTNQRRRFNI